MDENLLAQKLKKIRLEHNIKQEDISRALGIDRSAYSGYEIGRANPSVKCLCSLADIYNVSLSQLVGREEVRDVIKIRITDASNVSSEVDPIAMLDRDEQLLLMYFRLVPKERKKDALDFFASFLNEKN